MKIVQVDPYDDRAFDAWHAVYHAADGFGREEWASPWSLVEARAERQAEVAFRWHASYAVEVDGAFVAAGEIRTPLLENLDLAEIAVHTHPEHRRRGYGTALLDHLERVARERGRSKLVAEASPPYEGPADGTGWPGVDFLFARGFVLALGEVMRIADLPVDDALLDRLEREAAPHHAAYTLRSFVGPVPDELAQGFAEVTAALTTDAPTGDLDIEPDTPNVESMREAEAIIAAQGRTKYNTVAVDESGDVVAYTELALSADGSRRVYQWGTLVRRAHRGHRLGLAVKAANLRFLQGLRDDVDRLVTYNAEVNTHMIAVNEAMGFRPVERIAMYTKRLS